MSEHNVPGHLGWLDLTVRDAEGIRDFYADVLGWTVEPQSMGEYEDFVMMASDGEAIAGICHDRGGNADLPATWIPYVVVDDLTGSIARARERGGHVLGGVREMGGQGRYAFLRDPAGAVMALFQHTGD
jgi:predicted enzyme related to lactoylglutathione lyase